MKALTVQQPWAWAIVHGGKDIENRTTLWKYRGPLAIHAGTRWSDRGTDHPLITAAAWRAGGDVLPTAQKYGPDFVLPGPEWPVGAIIGTVDLVEVHLAEGEQIIGALRHPACCDSPWAELSYAEHGGRTRRDLVHLVLENPRPLVDPIPCLGRLGLWTPPRHVTEQLEAA